MKQVLFVIFIFCTVLSKAQDALDYAKIKDAQELDLSNLEIDTLPSYIGSCSRLKRINLSGNRKLKVIDTFKKLAKLPKLEVLQLDYCNLFFLPAIIGEFKALKVLSIQGNGIAYLPLTFRDLALQELNVASNRIDSLNIGFSSLRQLRTFNFSNNEGISRDYNMDLLATLPLLHTLVLRESKSLSNNIGKLRALENIDLSGSTMKILPSAISQLAALKSIDVRGSSELDVSAFIETIAPLKQLRALRIGDAKMTVVPFNISKLKSLRDLRIYGAALGRLPVSFKELSLQNIHFVNCSFSAANDFFSELDKMSSLQLIYLEESAVAADQLPIKKQVVTTKVLEEEAPAFNNRFNELAKNHRAETPVMDYDLLTSKVTLTIKKQVTKKRFYFGLEPQYGYTEKYLDLFGDKIKAYPELKVYKGIQWEYTGSEMDPDLLKMYALSEKTDKEKAKKKSTVEIYVLNLQDILIYPEKEEDTYVLAFSRGFDTLKIKALPALSLLDAKKIQKWHKGKYENYLQQRIKREEKWLQLDKKYLMAYEKYEIKLEDYRAQLNELYYHAKEK
jgi:Leucine-rich repeat (LRR) protein